MNKETAQYLLGLVGLNPSEDQIEDTIFLHNHLVTQLSQDPTLTLANVEPYYIQPIRTKRPM